MKNLIFLKIALIFLLFLTCVTSNILLAQACNTDSPQAYTTIPDPANPGQCFLIIDWGAAMAKLECGTPGTPASGSTVPNNRKLLDISVIINGVTIILYDKQGGNCNGSITDLVYGPDVNSYITTYSSTAFCDASYMAFAAMDGNQAGASVIDCDVTNAVPAPVTLSYFKGATKDNSNFIQWATSSEENVEHFSLERSIDGIKFDELVQIAATGFSTETQYYDWEDKTENTINYYRLKSVDFDGYFEYSDIIVLKNKPSLDATFNVFPNPVVGGYVNLKLILNKADEATIRLFDITGKQLQTMKWDCEEGDNTLQLSTDLFKNKLTLVQVQTSYNTIVKRVIR